ncbi:MAG: ATP-binding protein [Alphaproteobacteria bacterium]|nr:ATP-binding protein [Alphaproteobacteria bacterium]
MLRADLSKPFPKLVNDPLRLRQILINLTQNAVKFTPKGGTVTLSAEKTAEGGVAFLVSDNGIGMAPEHIKIALAPFGQVDGGLDRMSEGVGLGLPLSKKLVELHGGRFTIEWRPGDGTTLTAAFPAWRSTDGSDLTVRKAS